VSKYIHPQNGAFSGIFGPDLTRCVVTFCMGIAICHRREFGQVWGSPAPLPEVARKHRGRKAPIWTFDYHMEQELSYRKQIARQLRTQYVEGIYDNPVILKCRIRITQDHWKMNHSVDHTRLTISRVI